MKTVNVQGAQVPALGFGTWQIEGDDCVRGVKDALDLGYRHIDTAQVYENEEEVGAGLKKAAVSRSDVWLTTKVWYEKATPDEVTASTEESLRKLGVDAVDLLLFHWPNDRVPMEDTLGAMVDLQKRGLTKRIGVSNFTPSQLTKALSIAPIFAIQVEYHPYLAQEPILRICREHDLLFTAYSPLARGKVLEDDTLIGIGRRHDKSPAQVVLRWMIQQDKVSAIPKASSSKHRKANLAIHDFELDANEMKIIDELASGKRIIDPSFAPKWENQGQSR